MRFETDFFDKTVTIINQIPQSEKEPVKIAWTKTVLAECDVVSGVRDRSSGTMVYRPNSFTVYARDTSRYRPPNFSGKGYYSVYRTEKDAFTACAGDLVILREISEEAPTTIAEFNALRTKYAREGGILTDAEAFENFRRDGTPWKTNHIEMVKE